MYPVLIELGDFKIFSYGATLATTGLIIAIIAWRERPAGLFSFHQFLNICLLTAVGATFGARLGSFLVEDQLSLDSLLKVLVLWERTNLASIGVPVFVLPTFLLYISQARLPVAEVCDYFAPLVLLGAALHRAFGCFLAGCCLGRATELPWGVTFPGMEDAVHPTQLYLSLGFLMAFIGLNRWRPARSGCKSLATIGLYAIVNSLTNFYRVELGPLIFSGVTLLQLAYLLMVAASAVGLLVRLWPGSTERPPAPARA